MGRRSGWVLVALLVGVVAAMWAPEVWAQQFGGAGAPPTAGLGRAQMSIIRITRFIAGTIGLLSLMGGAVMLNKNAMVGVAAILAAVVCLAIVVSAEEIAALVT